VKIAGVALLRAVNVGGAGKLLMRDRAAIFIQFGCTSVETYIQSGNVVFVAPEEAIATLPGLVSAALRRQFGLDASVLIRRRSEWRRVIEENPFLKRNVNPKELHVMFLGAPPREGATNLLDVNRSPPDEFVLRDKEIYLRLPNGVGRSKLANSYFEKMLGASATMRNWRTVLMLDEMTRAKG
jgi:uncharacterized protein (DUF1697 family)